MDEKGGTGMKDFVGVSVCPPTHIHTSVLIHVDTHTYTCAYLAPHRRRRRPPGRRACPRSPVHVGVVKYGGVEDVDGEAWYGAGSEECGRVVALRPQSPAETKGRHDGGDVVGEEGEQQGCQTMHALCAPQQSPFNSYAIDLMRPL